ncbi:retrovirus-related pol polyprotein from transposon TNT 1-94 [Tanacetum coccineum]
MSHDREHYDQDDDDLAKERDLLAYLIEKLKCKIDDSKNRNKFLESSNKTLVDKLKVVKCECLKNELSKRNTTSKSFEALQQHAINLELALQQCQEHIKNDKAWKEKESNSFRVLNVKYFEIQDLKAQLQDKGISICEFKKLIEKMKGKSVETKTKQPIVVPISTRKPKRNVNQSVATPLKKLVAAESTNQKPQNKIRKQYDHLIEIILSIIASGCSKHMTRNLKLLTNFVEKFLDLEVAFRKSTCYICDLKGNYLLTSSSSQAWLWHRRLSHLNFDTINLLSKYDIVIGLPKLKFVKDHLYILDSTLEIQERESTKALIDFLKLVHRGLHDYVRTNRTLVEAARTMLSAAKVPLFFWAEAIAMTWYSTQSRAYRVYNKSTRVIVKTIHVNFDALPHMSSDHISSDPVPQYPIMALEQSNLSLDPQSQENVPLPNEIVTTSNELDLLFSLMFNELLNGTTQVVSKSSAVNAVDAPDKRQQQNTTSSTSTTVAVAIPPLNIQTTPETTNQTPTVTST